LLCPSLRKTKGIKWPITGGEEVVVDLGAQVEAVEVGVRRRRRRRRRRTQRRLLEA